MQVSIVIPVYNEGENILLTLEDKQELGIFKVQDQ